VTSKKKTHLEVVGILRHFFFLSPEKKGEKTGWWGKDREMSPSFKLYDEEGRIYYC
jgi:hypothetical protein